MDAVNAALWRGTRPDAPPAAAGAGFVITALEVQLTGVRPACRRPPTVPAPLRRRRAGTRAG
jgi:hypothetical protein